MTGVRRQHDNFCTGELDTDRGNRVDTIHLGHLQVHHCYVRAMNAKLLDGSESIRRFGDDHDVRLNSNAPAESFADNWVVVSDENARIAKIRVPRFDPGSMVYKRRRSASAKACASVGKSSTRAMTRVRSTRL